MNPQMSAKIIAHLDRILTICVFGFFICAPCTIAGTQFFLVLGLFFAIAKILLSKNLALPTMPILKLILLLVVVQIIANVFSGNFIFAMRSQMHEWLPLTVIFWGAIAFTEQKWRKALDAMVAVATVFSIYAIIQHFSGWDILRGKSLEHISTSYIAIGPFTDHLTFGGVYLMLSLFAFGYLLSGGANTKWRKFSYFAFIILSSIAIIFSYARSLWFSLAIALLFGTIVYRKKIFLYVVVGIALLWIVMLFVFPSILLRLETTFGFSFGSNVNRAILWETAQRMIFHSPIIGLGSGGFFRNFDKFFPGGFCPVRCHPHNDYLNVLVEAGIIGLLVYIAIFYFSLRKGYERMRNSAGVQRGFLMGAIIAIFGIMIAGNLECFFVNDETQQIIIFLLSVCFLPFGSESNSAM